MTSALQIIIRLHALHRDCGRVAFAAMRQRVGQIVAAVPISVDAGESCRLLARKVDEIPEGQRSGEC